ncbi:MAG TPA: hypothetical protein DCE42_10150 [Myxococcales bacterium]|nr:hypothetical protein [Myxococcales bacterium]
MDISNNIISICRAFAPSCEKETSEKKGVKADVGRLQFSRKSSPSFCESMRKSKRESNSLVDSQLVSLYIVLSCDSKKDHKEAQVLPFLPNVTSSHQPNSGNT